uniref:Thyroglobulin type-1 domain-containing protein n=1 Tax=Angiostrongylus cantonensis TaxID=6313 RepID=A0A0K0DBQ1_ANGCA
MSQFLIFIAVIVINTIDSRIIRQIEEEQSDMAVADWDPTIRNRFESCHSIASFAPTSEQYCKAFNMCCSMLFDPNNGDKCQTNEQRCIPLEDGDADAVCIQRNCTELVTTTTTTTTEAPVSEETSLNIAGSVLEDFLQDIAGRKRIIMNFAATYPGLCLKLYDVSVIEHNPIFIQYPDAN